jgi:hypothetical protein
VKCHRPIAEPPRRERFPEQGNNEQGNNIFVPPVSLNVVVQPPHTFYSSPSTACIKLPPLLSGIPMMQSRSLFSRARPRRFFVAEKRFSPTGIRAEFYR